MNTPDSPRPADLAAMDARLAELERQLDAARVPARPTAPPPSPAAASTASAATPSVDELIRDILSSARADAAQILQDARRRVAALNPELDELERLVREARESARVLTVGFDRALGDLERDGLPTLHVPAAPVRPAVDPPTPAAPVGTPPAAAAIPQPPAAAPEGLFRVDAGPFTDVAMLSLLETALLAGPGVKDVYVRSFEGRRASIEVGLESGGDPFAGLDTRVPYPVTVRPAGADAAVVDVLEPAAR